MVTPGAVGAGAADRALATYIPVMFVSICCRYWALEYCFDRSNSKLSERATKKRGYPYPVKSYTSC